MSNKDFVISDDGLGFFPELEVGYGVKNAVTYRNSKWGNMNPFYAKDDGNRLRISENDRIIGNMMEVDHLFSITTPHADTFLHLEKGNYDYLRFISKIGEDPFIETVAHANAVVVDSSIEEPFELVMAPFDSATFTLVHPDWGGFVFLHIGAPQVVENIDLKVLTYVEASYPDLDLSKMKVFITPYICMDHYSINVEKFENSGLLEDEVAKPFYDKRMHKIFGQERYHFDFVGLAKARMEETFGIKSFVESGMCNYEEATKGNLFSHELIQESEFRAREGEDVNPEDFKGACNVIVAYQPEE